MMKIVIAPDSFKGTLDANDVGLLIKDVFNKHFNKQHIKVDLAVVPIADGGEGTSIVLFENLGGKRRNCSVTGPEGESVEASYTILDNNVAVIEVAESSGLKHCHHLDTKKTNTFGLGEMILDALDQNVKEIMICLGGSGTTDGGAGMAAALGAIFTTTDSRVMNPNGESLKHIKHISIDQMDSRIAKTSFKILSDVNNPLYGPNGAAYIYGPQKGATPEDVIILDAGLKHYGILLEETFNKDCSSFSGAGAAGGLGAGCFSFLNAEVFPGIETILEMINFDKIIKDADVVITGEGKLDEQSFMGKAISGVINHAKHKQVIVICGDNACSQDCLKDNEIKVFAATDYCTKEESLINPRYALKIASEHCALYVDGDIKK